jgi:predicted nucleic acid-binding protein
VLIPPGLRDLLLSLADVKALRPVWSEEILAEVRRNLPERLASRGHEPGIAAEMTERTIATMNRAFPDACLPADAWRPLVEHMTNDAKDRHVLAAAGSNATHVVTANVRHFPVRSRPVGVHVVRPDAFLLHVLDRDRATVLAGVEAMANRHRRPAHTPVELAGLLSTGVHTPRFGTRLLELHATGEWPN